MKIEYIESGSSDCPLIRIYGSVVEEFLQLQNAVKKLANGSENTIIIENLPGFEIIDNSSLIFILWSEAEGFKKTGNKFELKLTVEEWITIDGLIDPFTMPHSSPGFQWLWDNSTQPQISLLISCYENGGW